MSSTVCQGSINFSLNLHTYLWVMDKTLTWFMLFGCLYTLLVSSIETLNGWTALKKLELLLTIQ